MKCGHELVEMAHRAVQEIAGAWDMVGFSIQMRDDAEKIVASLLQSAVEGERERCAKVAEGHGEPLRGLPGISEQAVEDMNLHGAQIADNIRSTGAGKGD